MIPEKVSNLMPFLDVNGVRIRYEWSGLEAAPPLVFSNSLGTDIAMWDSQTAALSRDFRILRYDTRGHGRSSVMPGPYTINQLADDVVGLLDELELERSDFCGLSIGGLIAMSLALRVPQRLRKVVLCNTAAKIGSHEIWNARIDAVRKGGMAAVVPGILERWYTAEFRSASPEAVESTRRTLLSTSVEGYAGCCAALRDVDLRNDIAGIHLPVLIIAGAHDPATTPADGRFLAERIAGSRYVELRAAHLSNIEASGAFTMELSAFLKA
jgi:3-oxoadipate enol-lactonase